MGKYIDIFTTALVVIVGFGIVIKGVIDSDFYLVILGGILLEIESVFIEIKYKK